MSNNNQIAILDPNRLHPFQPCVDNYGTSDYTNHWAINDLAATDPWVNNCLASNAVAYSNGLITRNGNPIDLRFDPTERTLCSRLASQAARVMGSWWPGMYSANTPVTSEFFATSASFQPRPNLDAPDVRALFGGALIDEARIVVEDLAESGEWWDLVLRCATESQAEDPEFDSESEVLKPWRNVIEWFRGQRELCGCSMVRIQVKRHRGVRGGCVFPWLAVGITEKGSLAGVSTCLVKG